MHKKIYIYILSQLLKNIDFSWNLNPHYSGHRYPSLHLISPLSITISSKSYFNQILPNGLLSIRFRLHSLLKFSYPIHFTCPLHLTIFELIVLTILAKNYKLLSLRLHRGLYSLVSYMFPSSTLCVLCILSISQSSN